MENLTETNPAGRYGVDTDAAERFVVVIYTDRTTQVGRGLPPGSTAPTLRSDGRMRPATSFSFAIGSPGSVIWKQPSPNDSNLEPAVLTGRVVTIRRVGE